MIDTENLKPFPKFCYTIGMIPTSYKESLTYEEQLMWLCDYLKNTVIPTVNNNGQAVTELQNLYVELKNYVDNYFKNLDIQKEINNKLDEMATDGTLENIINQEIFEDINNSITQLKRNALYIGNSYTNGVGSTSGSDGLFNLTKNLFNTAFKKTGSGTGFLPYTNHENDTFISQLNNAIIDNNIDNNSITDIIIVGAWGDSRAYREIANLDSYKSAIINAMSTFVNTVKQNFPNVIKISFAWAESMQTKNSGGISTYPHYFSDSFNIHNLFKYICPKCGIQYLGWLGFNILLDASYFSDDGYHPNDNGYQMLASYFKSAYANGVINYKNLNFKVSGISSEIINGATNDYSIIIYPDRCLINFITGVLPTGNTPTHGSYVKLFDFINQKFQLPVPFESAFIGLGAFEQIGSIGGSSAYNPSKNIIGKLRITKDTENLGNTYLQVQTIGPSINIASQVTTALILGGAFEYSLDDVS